MSSVRERRDSITRDLDAFLSRLHDLKPTQWNLPTPDEGWEIRHLASHLAGTSGKLTAAMRMIVNPDIAVALRTGEDVTPDSDPEDIIGSLTVNRNAMIATLAEFTNDHLETAAGIPGSPLTGDNILDIATCEAGIHLYDLNAALDHGSAGLSDATIDATVKVFNLSLLPKANGNAIKPEAPVSFHFDGSAVDCWMTWTGTDWVTESIPGTPVTLVHGDDTPIVLFVVGRIPVSDHRLGISGNREPLTMFKTWVPGP